MAIPLGIFQIEILLALLGTAYCWFGYDPNNYSDAISGVLGTIFWFTSGLSLGVGIHSDGIDYTGGWLSWIFLGIGVIAALITFVKLLDTVRLRRAEGKVDMNLDMEL